MNWLLLACAFLTSISAFALPDDYEILTTKNQVFTNARILSVSGTNVLVNHGWSVSRVPIVDLPEALISAYQPSLEEIFPAPKSSVMSGDDLWRYTNCRLVEGSLYRKSDLQKVSGKTVAVFDNGLLIAPWKWAKHTPLPPGDLARTGNFLGHSGGARGGRYPDKLNPFFIEVAKPNPKLMGVEVDVFVFRSGSFSFRESPEAGAKSVEKFKSSEPYDPAKMKHDRGVKPDNIPVIKMK